MGQALSPYWWIIIPLALAILLFVFSLERRSSKDRKAFPKSYIDGLRAMIGNDENTAFVKLKQAVADDTDNVDAYLKLGDLFRKRNMLEKAIQVHRELLIRKNLGSDIYSQVRKSLVEDYIQAKKYDSALDILEKLVKDNNFKLWAREKMLEVYEKTETWDKAFNVCKGILKSKEQQNKLAVYKFLIGRELYDDSEFHKARLAFKDALHYDKNFAPAYIMIAESYLAEDRKTDAVDYFRKLAKNVPAEAYRSIHKMEQTLFELGQFSEVEDIYKEILKVCPEDTNILKALAGIAEKKGDISGSIDTLSQLFTADSKDISAIVKLAELYLNNNQNDKALEVLETLQKNCSSGEQHYVCSYCQTGSSNQDIICPQCQRVGPYKRL